MVRRSPLALVVLVLLVEGPAHPYRMHELIKERDKAKVANVASRNSVYQAVDRLERLGLIAKEGVARDAGRPERTLYKLTPAGTATMLEWTRAMLSEPAVEYPEFPAALASMPVLEAGEVADLLSRRADTLEAGLQDPAASGLPRVFVIEDEYAHVLAKAEIGWLRSVVADLRSGALGWSAEWQADGEGGAALGGGGGLDGTVQPGDEGVHQG